MINQQQKLDQLRKKLQSQNPTPSLAKNARNLVFGSGDPNADIVIIGEAPGKNEDESGEPFVGASGKRLNEMLAQINLTRQDVYITNIVKYRPPENRDPKDSEKDAHMEYLLEQIRIIQPTALVTLGRHSGQVFKQDLRISDDHGVAETITIDGLGELLFIPQYHPAASLYNGKLRDTLFADFRAIPQQILKFSKKENK